MKCQNRQFTKFISLLKFPGLQYLRKICRVCPGKLCCWLLTDQVWRMLKDLFISHACIVKSKRVKGLGSEKQRVFQTRRQHSGRQCESMRRRVGIFTSTFTYLDGRKSSYELIKLQQLLLTERGVMPDCQINCSSCLGFSGITTEIFWYKETDFAFGLYSYLGVMMASNALQLCRPVPIAACQSHPADMSVESSHTRKPFFSKSLFNFWTNSVTSGSRP